MKFTGKRNKKAGKQWLTQAFVLLLAVSLCMSGIVGCGKKKEDDKTQDGQQTEQEKGNKPEDGVTDNTQGTEGEPEGGNDAPEDNGEITLPLSEEKAELSMWVSWSNDYIDSINDIPAMKAMEERTNVHMKYVEVAGSEATEKYGLMLASGDYPDMLWHAGRSYPGGLSKGVSDGILVDLTEYVEQYMPNYKSWYTIEPEYEKRVLTDEGKNIGIYELFCDFSGLASEPEWNGLAIRQDWLDRLGLPTPVTMEDWTNTLTKSKEEIGCAKPLMVGPTGSILSKAFLSAYGVTDEFYVDGVNIKYGPAEPGFKEWLALMADWYKKGLLDPDFVSASSGAMMADNGEIANGTTGAFPTITPFLGEGMKLTGYEVEDGFYISAIQAPVLNAGDVVQYRTPVQVVNMSHCVVTTNCKDIPLACKWLDYQYTKEGMLFNCLGVEGESYVENADGTYSFTELITNNPDGYSPTDAISVYTRMGAGNLPGLYNFFKDTVTVTDAQREGIATWMKDGDAMCIPDHMSMTEEEGTAYNFLYTALKTMANEYTVHVITGIESVDTFDEFVASLYEHGLEECLGYQQAAYDRFLNR